MILVHIIRGVHLVSLHVELVQSGSLLGDEAVRRSVSAHSLLVYHREPMTWSCDLVLTNMSHLSTVVAGRLVWHSQVQAAVVALGAVLF